jgi:hypothetical protein
MTQPFVVDNPLLEPFVCESPAGFSTEASDLGFTRFPGEISFRGLVYEFNQTLVDREGETYGVEYRSGSKTFTVWND